jgi:hypothetical protein
MDFVLVWKSSNMDFVCRVLWFGLDVILQSVTLHFPMNLSKFCGFARVVSESICGLDFCGHDTVMKQAN